MKISPFLSLSCKTSIVVLTTSLLVCGCSPKNEGSHFSETDLKTLHKTMQRAQIGSQAEITEAMNLLYKGDYKEASLLLNRSIMDDPKNSVLHYLNGLTYHLRAERGDGDYHDLATQGYLTALRLDPTNWQASKQIGHIMLKSGRPKHAQEAFAEALLYNPNSAEGFHNLAVASYYAHDVPRAYRYALMAVQKDPENPIMIRSAALISAAADEKNNAKKYLDEFKKHEKDTQEVNFLERRMADWDEFYRSGRFERAVKKHKQEKARQKQEEAKNRLATLKAKDRHYKALNAQETQILNKDDYLTNLSDNSSMAPPSSNNGSTTPSNDESSASSTGSQQTTSQAPASTAQPSTATTAPATVQPSDSGQSLTPLQKAVEESSKLKEPPIGTGNEMVILDGVVMRVSEEGITSKGNNILANLTAVATLLNSRDFSEVKDLINPANTTKTITYNRNAAIGLFSNYTGATISTTSPLIYSLQLANAQRQFVEVIGRPTISVRMGQKGDFYSGDDRWLALTGQYGGNVEKIPIGIGLTVTPVKIDDQGVLTLQIKFKGQSVLSAPPVGEVQNNYLIVANSYVTTEVQARIGETLVLGGINLRDDTQTKNGFPFLQSIPGLQYFFSNEVTDSARRTVLYMLTVRGYGKDMKSINEFFKKEDLKQVAVAELDERYVHWFAPGRAVLGMLKTLKPVYREFRTGDLSPVKWHIWEKPSEVIRESMAFLYY